MSFLGKKVFALIPARGDSKGIKNKNLYPIGEKVLIDFTIEAATTSKNIDYVYVSSDSIKILNLAKLRDVRRIARPKNLAKDTSTAVDVVKHFYDFLLSNNVVDSEEDFFLVYLQPTSPLRTSEDIDNSFDVLRKSNKFSLISLVKNKYSPYKSFLVDATGSVESLFDEKITNANRQDLRETYRSNGAIYTFLISQFISNKGFPSNKSVAFIMSEKDSLDIDSYDDIDILKPVLVEKGIEF